MNINTILSSLQPLKKLVGKVSALTLDNRFLGYLNASSDPLPCFLAWSIGESPCAPQYSDIKQ